MTKSTAVSVVLISVATGPMVWSADDTRVEPDRAVEVHAVCVYEGEKDSGFAHILVDRPGKTAVLYVAGFDTAAWNVNVTPGTKLLRVIASGYDPQEVGVPAGVPIVEAWQGRRSPCPGAVLEQDRRLPRFRDFVSRATAIAGADRLSSFQSVYRPTVDFEFVVDKVEPSELLLAGFPFVAEREDVPEDVRGITVRTEYYEPGNGTVSLLDVGLFGPDSASRTKLPNGVDRFVAGAGKAYGISGKDVVEIDLDNGTTRSFPGKVVGVAGVTWLSDVAFDSKRNRLVAHCSAGRRLDALDVATGKWSELAENVDAGQLAYSSDGDCLYGLEKPHQRVPLLRQFDERGRLLRTIVLEGPVVSAPLSDESRVTTTRLESAGKYLVVITSSASLERPTPETPERRIHLVDPKTGQSWLTWRSTAVPENDEATE